MSFLYKLVVLSVLLFNFTKSARILAFFPVPSISHQVVFRPLTEELARRGHEVIVITPDPAFPKGEAPPNLREIDVHDISYKVWKEKFVSTPKENSKSLTNEVRMFLGIGYAVVSAQLIQEDVQDLINNKNETFDLLLLEACVRSALALSFFYKVPVIQVSSFSASYGNLEAVGAPLHPFLYPSINRKKNKNFTLWEKINVLYDEYQIAKINEEYEKIEDVLLKRLFGPEIPSVSELWNNVHMLFLNVHPVFEGIPPSVVYIGGLHVKPPEELPADIKSLLDSSKQGVIYISFGSNVDPSLLPPEKIQMLVRVFSQLPYVVLWRWVPKELPGRTENIKTSNWWPQADLLNRGGDVVNLKINNLNIFSKHPNVKLFITQGGLQSTDEAITAGVPLIGIPMFGDQWLNTERYIHHKIGVRLDMETLTEEEFRNAIDTVIGDDSYRRNIVKLRNWIYDQPQSPLERAVWWTEHVLRHGGARHLRAPAANMSWAQYLELELVLTLLIGLLVILSVLAFGIICLCKLLRKGGNKVKTS